MILFQYLAARDIAGHQIGGELHAAKRQIGQRGQCRHQHRLGQSRHALQNAVAAAQHSDQQLLRHFVLSHDDSGQLFAKCRQLLVQLVDRLSHIDRFFVAVVERSVGTRFCHFVNSI